MLEATAGNVAGDFSGVSWTGPGGEARFFRRDGSYWVNTAGPDGRRADFRVAYTFGVAPLQQYLLELPGGRLQALDIAWDTQQKRWFSLKPGESIGPHDELHWTKPAYNANFMCVECHTTGYKRNFDADTDRFASHWQSLGVGCQACHGPASQHIAWTTWAGGGSEPGKGFEVSPQTAGPAQQVKTCARCHAHRVALDDGSVFHHRLLDDYLPSLLTRELYQTDGKIQEEVFEYGSFIQSKMFAKGVQCSDCHNPHSGRLKHDGNGVCLQCHNVAATATRAEIDGRGLKAKNYDSIKHHQHSPGSPGAQCIACHMPGRYYMVNDYRHDHGFTVPDPTQALRLGTTDACLGCHADKPEDEVVKQFRLLFSEPAASPYAQALHKARKGLPGASQALLRALDYADLPAIQRATLVAELPGYPSQRTLARAVNALGDLDPLVRQAAIQAIAALTVPEERTTLLAPRLNDSQRAVRVAAAWQLAQVPPPLRTGLGQAFTVALREYEEIQLAQADRAEANLNLALLYQATGQQDAVEPALRQALRRNPDFLPAVVALTQWLEHNGRHEKARQLLEESIARHPQVGLLRHALALSLVRTGQRDLALSLFQEAVQLNPDDDQFRLVLAVALHDAGQQDAAVDELERLLSRHPANRVARLTLISYQRQRGQVHRADVLLSELKQLNPDDPLLRQN